LGKKNPQFFVGFTFVRERGFEPPTNRAEICYSIQLNYSPVRKSKLEKRVIINSNNHKIISKIIKINVPLKNKIIREQIKK
jgi:hypothetical protein